MNPVSKQALAIALALAAPMWAQQNAQPAQQQDQQPGQNAQVHTGTSVGVEIDTRLRNMLATHEYFQLEKSLDQLPPDQQQLYRGILANRNNDAKASIADLEPLLDKIHNPEQEKLLRKTLAEDYLRTGDLLKAAKAYEVLSGRFHGKLSQEEQDEIELPLKLLPLAVDHPAMTVEPSPAFQMQVSRNPLGVTEVPVFVDAHPHRWMLDPTAPFNLIAHSVAREVGLKLSDQTATIHTLTGQPMQLHSTLIPRLTVGGRLEFHNVTAFVYEDKDYRFSDSHFQLQGVLGFPAVSALGSLTITEDATIFVEPNKTGSAAAPASKDPGSRFFLDGDQIILALGPAGSERMYALDAAGQQSYLTSRYYNEHEHAFSGTPPELFTVPGSDRYPPQPAFTAETVPLLVGATVIRPHFLQVITHPIGDAAIDDVYGVLGVDVLDQLHSYTFDYRTMRFSVKSRD